MKRIATLVLVVILASLSLAVITSCEPTPTPVPVPTPTPVPIPIPGLVEATQEQLTVHFIDVGQGDSILIDLGEIEVLIDGGGRTPGVVKYLRNHVEGPLEVMVATHSPCGPHRWAY
ncbi:hypothetical protein ACFLTP_03455 [Chloroflexota bacterium]